MGLKNAPMVCVSFHRTVSSISCPWPQHQSISLSPSRYSPSRPRHGNSSPGCPFLTCLAQHVTSDVVAWYYTTKEKMAKVRDPSIMQCSALWGAIPVLSLYQPPWHTQHPYHAGFPESLICRWATEAHGWQLPVALFPSGQKPHHFSKWGRFLGLRFSFEFCHYVNQLPLPMTNASDN